MAVPYTFGSATTSIPLSQLDSNFATTITLGNNAVQLGNTVTSLTGLTNVYTGTLFVTGSDSSIQRNGGNTWVIVSSNTGYGSNGVHLKLDSSTAAGFFGFYSQGTSILEAAGAGNTVVLQGGSTSAGTGIAFPATQNASSNANTLDDYEEGTFTPSFSTDGTAPVISASTAYGSYTKIGRIVNFIIHLSGTTVTSVGTGNMVIAGLPFGVAGDYATFSVGFVQGFTTNQPNMALGRVSLSNMWVYYRTAANGGPSNSLAAEAKTGMEIYISGAYQTNT